MKLLMIVLDGVGDRPCKALNGKTPLEAAETPNLDRMATEGQCGLLDTIKPGVCPGSDTSHLALFGYDPYEVYTGRGPLEAMGAGAEVRPGDVAFRCNFATFENGEITDRRAGRIKERTAELAAAVSEIRIDGIEVVLVPATEHRAALILRGEGLDSRVSDVDPHHDGPPLMSRPLDPAAEKTAAVLNEVVKQAHEIMDGHPVNVERREKGLKIANYLIPRGAGTVPELPSILDRWGFTSAASIAGVSLVKGVCQFVGFETITVEGATGGIDTDHLAKGKAMVAALRDHDFVFCNVKATDIFGHDGDAIGKRDWITSFDSTVGYLLDNLEDTLVAITGDHSTPCDMFAHSSDPVPLVIWGPGQRVDLAVAFNERAVSQGSLHGFVGQDVMPYMMGLAGRTEKFGA